ncbi:MAG TPA: DUF971 domain-containing protein [Ignavibacteriaceae bacterium]|nr:DUF971 domain-containing protein [Ignavibacteriaceae bacterium]
MKPAIIKVLDKKNLFINWEDGSESLIDLKKLRRLCPCATCASQRDKQSKSFIPVFNERQSTISSIKEIGNYAISISWKDGHNTGIYEFPFLKNLSENL